MGGTHERAVTALAAVPGLSESLVDGRSLRARADRGASAVPAVLSALDGAGIGVASVTVSRPSLDDVYLRHTGRAFRHDRGVLRMTAIAHSAYMTQRHTRVLLRQPWFVAITLVQPIIWLLLFGALFRSVTEIPGFTGGGSYLDYLVPGVVIMTALMSSGWSGMGIIEDMDRGLVDRFLASPVHRSSMIVGPNRVRGAEPHHPGNDHRRAGVGHGCRVRGWHRPAMPCSSCAAC